MKTNIQNTVAALSMAVLLSFTLANCAGPSSASPSGWHNMGVGPKDNRPMPDANMPGRR